MREIRYVVVGGVMDRCLISTPKQLKPHSTVSVRSHIDGKKRKMFVTEDWSCECYDHLHGYIILIPIKYKSTYLKHEYQNED